MTVAILTSPKLALARCRNRAPYHRWTVVDEAELAILIEQGLTLVEIVARIHRPPRAVREKLRRMGLKARKQDRGPCDCDSCNQQDECMRCILEWRELPKPECAKAWPELPRKG